MGTRTVVVNGKFQKSTPKGSEAGDFLWITSCNLIEESL